MAQQILTVPETLKDKTKYYPVGNEWIALPELNELGQVESFNIISELHKGMIEFRGAPQQPILAPFLAVDGREQELTHFQWTRLVDWIPAFSSGTKLAAAGDCFRLNGWRGFVYLLRIPTQVQRRAASPWVGGELAQPLPSSALESPWAATSAGTTAGPGPNL